MPATSVYAVTVADVNGDRKPDVVAVTEDAVVWYENPSWAQARHHPQGDREGQRLHPAPRHRWRRPDRLRAGGRLASAGHEEPQHAPVARPRRDRPMADPPDPLRGADAAPPPLGLGEGQETGKKQLVVAALQGRGTKGPNWGAGEGVRVLVYDVPEKPDRRQLAGGGRRQLAAHDPQPSAHRPERRRSATRSSWPPGRACSCSSATSPGTGPRPGSAAATRSPSRPRGRARSRSAAWRKGGSYIATIEPWHGYQVVVYTPPSSPADRDAAAAAGPAPLWSRQVIAEPLAMGPRRLVRQPRRRRR